MGVSKRREREREARRNAILDAAQDAFLSRGFEAATMDEVAERAQLGKGTLYNYFHTKEDLLLGVVVRHQKKVISRFEQAAAEADSGLALVRELMLLFIDHMSKPPGRLKMVMTRWASGQPLHPDTHACAQFADNARHVLRILTGAIIRGQQDGSIRKGCDPLAATISLWSAILGTMLHRMQLSMLPEPNPFAGVVPSYEQAVDFYLQALHPTGSEQRAPAHSGVGARAPLDTAAADSSPAPLRAAAGAGDQAGAR